MLANPTYYYRPYIRQIHKRWRRSLTLFEFDLVAMERVNALIGALARYVHVATLIAVHIYRHFLLNYLYQAAYCL